MGCIRVEKITEYLCEPLSRCLRDDDPYVRKTAAISVAKLYDINAELVEDRGFLDMLTDLISDANPTVVANAIAALSEIAEGSGKDVLVITPPVLQKLLAALNECTEWGQVFILDSLSRYAPSDSREAEGIIDRVAPRLQHANSAVVMAASRVILRFLDDVSAEVAKTLTRKLAPPLVTMLNAEPEIQYVALRNINLIVQKRPRILEHEIKVFFCKYNDPIYVKMEKLEIIIRLISERNVDQVLLELKEYATEVDVDFVRKAVRAIGRCAIKLDNAAERCINVLLDLIQTKVNYVVQEAVVVIKDIFRKYPNRYESVIGTLCENLEDLDEPEAKAAMVWIIGEYAERIDNADDLLESFLETFQDETAQVQLQLLTATVKLFLKQPDSTEDMVQRILNAATSDSDNPDLRDRGYVYWRLLSSDPEAARAVILADKPEIVDDTSVLEPQLLDDLMLQISSLAAIYHKPAEAFVVKSSNVVAPEYNDGEDYDEEALEAGSEAVGAYAPPQSQPSAGAVDLLDLMGDGPVAVQTTPSSKNMVVLATVEAGQGVAIAGYMSKADGKIVLDLQVTNTASAPLQALAIQFNKNSFGLAPISPQILLSPPSSNSSAVASSLVLTCSPQMLSTTEPSAVIQAAIKNITTSAVFYFAIPVTLEALFAPGGAPMPVQDLVQLWKSIDETQEASAVVNGTILLY
jgi:AP-1 complex subunit beta-1